MTELKFICEIGTNWYPAYYGDYFSSNKLLERALHLIELAARSGGTHAKFQLFRKLYRSEKKQKELEKLQLPLSWIPILADACRENNIDFLCTPFYLEAVDILDPYVNEWKVASWDITFIPLLERIAQTGKPVILSTGEATESEIIRAYRIVWGAPVTLLHCTGGYPSPIHDARLARISYLQKFGFPVGFSSHITDPYLVASSVAFGAGTIEAHFDFEGSWQRSSRTSQPPGVEYAHSLNPEDFDTMVRYAKSIKAAMGENTTRDWGAQPEPRNNYRRNPVDWLRPETIEEEE
jgi:sialic acid synthase SpsE